MDAEDDPDEAEREAVSKARAAALATATTAPVSSHPQGQSGRRRAAKGRSGAVAEDDTLGTAGSGGGIAVGGAPAGVSGPRCGSGSRKATLLEALGKLNTQCNVSYFLPHLCARNYRHSFPKCVLITWELRVDC